MAKDKVSWNALWRIYKFKDPDGKIEEMLRNGADITEVIAKYADRFITEEVFEDNILLNSGATEIWNLVTGVFQGVTGENIGTGDGTTTTFNATLANTVVKPGTVSITDGTETITDNGDGTLTGSAGGSGTVNYSTGAVSVTFAAAPANGVAITADYTYISVYDNSYAQIGVGDSTTVEDATQTDLLGTNTAYKGMDAGYPSVSGNTVTFRATFGSTEANFAWNEFVVKHAVSGICLNRKVEAKGTKVSGETWTISLQLSLS